MIVGIFGDSFASSWSWRGTPTPDQQPWYELLGDQHSVTVHSAPGSGLWWAWNEYRKHSHLYERVIVLASTPQRMAIRPQADRWWRHVGPGWLNQALQGTDRLTESERKTLTSLEDWFLHVDPEYVQSTHDLMLKDLRQSRASTELCILPCFEESRRPPHECSLFDISSQEIIHYKIKEKHKNPWYYDIRPGHLSRENNEILAEKIQGWLEHSRAVQLRLKDFCSSPSAPESDYFDYSRTGGVAL